MWRWVVWEGGRVSLDLGWSFPGERCWQGQRGVENCLPCEVMVLVAAVWFWRPMLWP